MAITVKAIISAYKFTRKTAALTDVVMPEVVIGHPEIAPVIKHGSKSTLISR